MKRKFGTALAGATVMAASFLLSASPASAAAENTTYLGGGPLHVYVSDVRTTGIIQVTFTRTSSGNETDRVNLGWYSDATKQTHMGPGLVRVPVGRSARHTWPTYIGPGCVYPVMDVDNTGDGRPDYRVNWPATRPACQR